MIWNKIFGKHNHSEKEVVKEPENTNFNNNNKSPDHVEPFFTFLGAPSSSSLEEDDSKNATSRISFLTSALKKTRSGLTEHITNRLTKEKLSLDSLDYFEDILISADMGVKTATHLRDNLEKQFFDKHATSEDIKKFLSDQILELLKPMQKKLVIDRSQKPFVLSFVGVNGTGKTTTIGKMAYHFKKANLKVMLVAADTFRAAAVEQLTIWGERNDIPICTTESGGDASALIFDSYQKAKDDDIDILMIDTAGRLQNKHNLMQELLKMSRVLKKYDTALPHQTLLVLDATTGQNAMKQAEIFRDIADISGLIMTKLDGTAKGGVLVSIAHQMKLPIYGIGIGEKIEDLHCFKADEFAKALTH